MSRRLRRRIGRRTQHKAFMRLYERALWAVALAPIDAFAIHPVTGTVARWSDSAYDTIEDLLRVADSIRKSHDRMYREALLYGRFTLPIPLPPPLGAYTLGTVN